MRGARKIRRTAFGAQACQGNVLFLQALNTCFNILRGTQPCHRLHLPPSCWKPSWHYFHYFSLLGPSWALLARLGVHVGIFGRFFAAAGPPELVFRGPGVVLGGRNGCFFEPKRCAYACDAYLVRTRQNTVNPPTPWSSACYTKLSSCL